MNLGVWDARIRRANDLSSSYPFAAQGLRFYARVAAFQKNLAERVQKALAGLPKISSDRPLRYELDISLLLPRVPEFLSLIEQIAPAQLSDAAARLSQGGPAEWQHSMEDFWFSDPEFGGSGDATELQSTDRDAAIYSRWVLAWIFLQPYAECLASLRESAVVEGSPSTCPLCGSKPLVGVLRSEGDGAKKSLVCMLCAHEWSFRRIYCAACGEEREPQMAYYSAPEIAHVRVDVCDTCHTYLKTVDLTKTGLAIAVVDELATIPLDLWARDHGYGKLQINLLGI